MFVLVGIQAFVVGVLVTQVVTDHKVRIGMASMGEDNDLLHFYGSLDRSMLAIYQVMSEGIHWNEIMEPVSRDISPAMKIVFVFYSVLAIFVTMNVITGFFLDTALSTAADDKKRWAILSLCNAWDDLDRDASAGIDRDEFAVGAEKLSQYLKDIDISSHSLSDLFDVLDLDGDGIITTEELVHGCVRICGEAKAIDLAIIGHQMHRMEDRMCQMEKSILQRISRECVVQCRPTRDDLGRAV